METQVTETKSNLPANYNKSWGDSGVGGKDIIIPKFLIMQPTSELVGDKKRETGEIIDSLTEEVVGGNGQAAGFIPIRFHKEWRIMELVGNRFEFRTKEPWSDENANSPLEWEENGTTMRRDLVFNFFAMRPDKMDELPVLISFTRSSMRSGKKLATHFKLCEMKNIPCANKVWSVDTIPEKNEGNTYYVFDLKEDRETTEDELAISYDWFVQLSRVQVRAEDPEEKPADGVPF